MSSPSVANVKLEPEDQSENAIRVESICGAFSRSFVLPDYVDSKGIQAESKDGVLAHSHTQSQDQEIRTIDDRSALS